MRYAIAVVFTAICMYAALGCAAALPAIKAGVAILGAVLDAAELGADRYLDRHPNIEGEKQIADAMARARDREAAYRANPSEAAKTDMLEAWDELRSLLQATGVLDGKCPEPCGGPEGEGDEPKPLHLPTRAELAEAL